ncbi:hypothetical protein QEG98_11370 [Myxococcus sp. MxC21-1]|nr:hypothetical protein [Myxococcus sp. MxC21-1]WNZ64214.1 hypothetical protein QEG98_11370 [Myxococcus sp. MxC21-1]
MKAGRGQGGHVHAALAVEQAHLVEHLGARVGGRGVLGQRLADVCVTKARHWRLL